MLLSHTDVKSLMIVDEVGIKNETCIQLLRIFSYTIPNIICLKLIITKKKSMLLPLHFHNLVGGSTSGWPFAGVLVLRPRFDSRWPQS